MAIIGYKPDAVLPIQPNLPKIQSDNYKSIIYDDKNVPLHSLLAYIQGAPWTLDAYFQQVVSKHNDLREIDPGQANIYQQYQKIAGLELRVSSALTSIYDSETSITSISGNALMYPFTIPNISDYFIVNAGDSRKGIFRITDVERKTLNRDSAFYVEYEMVGYVEALPLIYDDLEAKVIRTYHFSKDRLVEGLHPLLKDGDYDNISSLKSIYSDTAEYYFKTFFNRKYMTLMVPGQDVGIYDSFLIDYTLKIVQSFDAYEIRSIRQIPTDNEAYLSQPQFWELMLNKDYPGLATCNQTMGLVQKQLFNNSAFIHGLAFTNIDYIVYPNTPDTSLIVHSSPNAKLIAMEEMVEATNVQGTIADLIDDHYIQVNVSHPLIHKVLIDTYYVLSQNFYNNTAGQSVLEILVKDYLKMQTINLDMLLALCSKFKTWGRLEQFYYGPILLTLVKEADRGTY